MSSSTHHHHHPQTKNKTIEKKNKNKKNTKIKHHDQDIDTLFLNRLQLSENNIDINDQGKVLWNGPYFGRLPKCGKDFLIQKGGWKELLLPEELNDDDDEEEEDKKQCSQNGINNSYVRLQFAWPNKSGPQFDIDDPMAPSIRPYPKYMTDILDDKLSLAQLLTFSSSNCDSNIGPKIITPPPPQDQEIENSDSSNNKDNNKLYFVKHRYGVQGKSVYVYNTKQLQTWYKQSKNTNDFVIQEEIIPTLDPDGRKFVLRSHILLFQRYGESIKAYVHKDVICLSHASKYYNDADNNDGSVISVSKSAHVSQAGKQHPKPILLEELGSDHPAANTWSQIQNCSQILIKLTATAWQENGFLKQQQQPLPEDTGACFALLGTDLLLSKDGTIKLCEVNSHPALGWGTMKDVPYQVYQRLIEDTLSLVVFNEFDENVDTGISNNGFRLIYDGDNPALPLTGKC